MFFRVKTRPARAEQSRLRLLCSTGLTTVLLSTAAPGGAAAAEPSPAAAPPAARKAPPKIRERRGRWYGWQMLAGNLIADAGVVIGLLGAHRVAPEKTALGMVPLFVGISSHVGVGLTVHAARREWGNLGEYARPLARVARRGRARGAPGRLALGQPSAGRARSAALGDRRRRRAAPRDNPRRDSVRLRDGARAREGRGAAPVEAGCRAALRPGAGRRDRRARRSF